MSEPVAYYPGCSGLGTSKEYDASTRAVCEAVGLPLVEIPDWNCCGSTPAHTKDHALAAALAARNLQLVAGLGLAVAATPCPSCLTNLRTAAHRMGIPILTLKKHLNSTIRDLFDYQAGVDPQAIPPLLQFKVEEANINERGW